MGLSDISLYIGNTQTAGHQMIALNYSICGKQCESTEPRVVYIDQKDGYAIPVLADNFKTSSRGWSMPVCSSSTEFPLKSERTRSKFLYPRQQ